MLRLDRSRDPYGRPLGTSTIDQHIIEVHERMYTHSSQPSLRKVLARDCFGALPPKRL